MQAWDPGQPADEQGEGFPLLEYLQLLWYRKKLIIAITVFVAAVGWIHVNQLRSIYTATSTLMLGVEKAQAVDIESIFSRNFYGDEIFGEMEVMKSRGLARKIVERLNLTNYEEFNPALRQPEESFFDFLQYLNPRSWIPRSWKDSVKEAMGQETRVDPVEPPTEEEILENQASLAANILLGKISVELVEFAGVVTIRASSLDRNMAARIANELPEAYIVDQLESRFEATEKANAWLSEQLGSWRTR
jgi:succinoglycan biosynthesis transport protein ExoP